MGDFLFCAFPSCIWMGLQTKPCYVTDNLTLCERFLFSPVLHIPYDSKHCTFAYLEGRDVLTRSDSVSERAFFAESSSRVEVEYTLCC